MGKKILWLDNDEAEIATWLNGLKREGHEVTNVTKLIQTWDLLATEAFDLLILDVMVPTQTEEEEVLFPPVETDLGHMSGLCFYKKLLADPTRNHLPVLVFTVRRDAKTPEAFKNAGLPESCFGRKVEFLDVPDFVLKVEEVIQSRHAAAAPPSER